MTGSRLHSGLQAGRRLLAGVHPAAWRVLIIVGSFTFYALAQSNSAYKASIPELLVPHQEVVRKSYALMAFAVVGFVVERARLPRFTSVANALAVGFFSFAIEIGQIAIHHSGETFAEHGFDVLSGIAGGAIGVGVSKWLGGHGRVDGRHVMVLALILVVVAACYKLTYR